MEIQSYLLLRGEGINLDENMINKKTCRREEMQPDPTTQIQLAVAELAEVSAQRDIENKLAIAELAEAMTGGK